MCVYIYIYICDFCKCRYIRRYLGGSMECVYTHKSLECQQQQQPQRSRTRDAAAASALHFFARARKRSCLFAFRCSHRPSLFLSLFTFGFFLFTFGLALARICACCARRCYRLSVLLRALHTTRALCVGRLCTRIGAVCLGAKNVPHTHMRARSWKRTLAILRLYACAPSWCTPLVWLAPPLARALALFFGCGSATRK
jgi:hypothetical protein